VAGFGELPTFVENPLHIDPRIDRRVDLDQIVFAETVGVLN
jgi:hypothetical protein